MVACGRAGGESVPVLHSSAQAVSYAPSFGKAQLFVDENYGGASATLEVGTYNISDGTGAVGNDSISSVRVEPLPEPNTGGQQVIFVQPPSF